MILSLVLVCTASLAIASDMKPRDGWVVLPTAKPFDTLVGDVIAATKDNGLAVVTQAGPTAAAARRGVTIPGNRVIGVFNNDFAVRILALSTAAMIEAPVRLYVTENARGAATLSYKSAAFLFAPYTEGGERLTLIAQELDERLTAIAQVATR